MSLATTIRALVHAGATPEMILAVVEAHEAEDCAAIERRRASDAIRQREKRERDRHVMSRDVTENPRDSVTPPAPPSSLPPTPPNPTTPTPPDISTRARGAAIAKPNGFARFWEMYPNKVGKAAAERAYSAACRKISGPDPPAVLLEGLERAKTSRQWLEGYIPHPTTWLNQGRWEDEPEPLRQALQTNQAKPNEPNRPDAKRAAREANYARAFSAPVLASGGGWD